MVGTSNGRRPFTRRIRQLQHKGYRYIDLQNRSNEARSTAWFNKLHHARDPWMVAPPPAYTFDGLARLMETTPKHVAQMIAEEWYGVRVTEQSDRVRALAPRLDALDDDDAQLVESIIQRLQPPPDDVLTELDA